MIDVEDTSERPRVSAFVYGACSSIYLIGFLQVGYFDRWPKAGRFYKWTFWYCVWDFWSTLFNLVSNCSQEYSAISFSLVLQDLWMNNDKIKFVSRIDIHLVRSRLMMIWLDMLFRLSKPNQDLNLKSNFQSNLVI